MKKIAVLMTCFNRVKTTLACLERLFAQQHPTGLRIDVWLVDDASPDKTGEKVKAAFPQVNVIQSPGNLFWCKGMRLAWERAVESKTAYDMFLWLNDDVELFDGALAGLLSDAELTHNEGIVIGVFASDSSCKTISYGSIINHRMVEPNGSPQLVKGPMSGNFVLIPRVVYEMLGPIYGEYSHGFGDYDYGWQADRHGIPRYVSSRICGVCPEQKERYNQRIRSLSLSGRIKLLFDPKGFPIRDSFIYQRRRVGLAYACLSVMHIIWQRVLRGKK